MPLAETGAEGDEGGHHFANRLDVGDRFFFSHRNPPSLESALL